MSRKAEILRSIVKKNPEPARGKCGTDPMDPWNAKSGLAEASEAELLRRYLKSRGINPDFIPRDTKIAHAKSSAYLSWRKNHEFDESVEVSEAVDKEDTITFDIPLLIRVLEYAREDSKDDMALHKVTEKLISIRDKGTLTMDDYDFITQIKESLDEGAFKRIATDREETKRLSKMTGLEKFRADSAAREKKHDTIQKNSGGMTAAIDRLEKHLNKEEVEQIDEISKTTLSSYKDKSTASLKNAQANRDAAEAGKDMSKGFADLHAKSDAIAKKRAKGLKGYLQRKMGIKPTSENTLDPLAATQATIGPGEQITPEKSVKMSNDQKKQMTKSARIIKSIYKRKNMKEETYDWEKDDKNTQVYGKKPKLKDTSDKDNVGEKKPDARAVLSGGTTMTGVKRDDVEIDPFLQKPKTNAPDYFEKPLGKKDK